MPSKPPQLGRRRTALKPSNWTRRTSRQERGYGRAHDLMREQVLREEPLCYIGLAMDPPEYHVPTIADHKLPKSEGGTDDRENYGAACDPCHRIKTAQESARARRRRSRPTP